MSCLFVSLKFMKAIRSFSFIFVVVAAFTAGSAEPGADAYQTDFERTDTGKVPPEFLILDGAFAVNEEGGNRFLELPGAPLDSFGAVFGPTCQPKTDQGMTVSARIQGFGRGRRYPAFGVGVCGVGGYRLRVMPSKRKVELYLRDEVLADADYAWEADQWTALRLEIRRTGESEWKVQGKAWPDGKPEPEEWILSYTEKNSPVPGQASIWGTPYSGRPIRFDDIKARLFSGRS